MRNLKRALSLALASVMLLGMMVVGANAAEGYTDVDKDAHNIEAIDVLQVVNVMNGYEEDGDFHPEDLVTRAQMARIMAELLNLDYDYYEAVPSKFTDVTGASAWAKKYVDACAANGIVSGRGNGIYDPAASVTAVEAASMMMRALGYFQNEGDYEGGFESATVKQASQISLFSKINGNAHDALNRNQVAQLALNTLESNMVYFDGDMGWEVNGVKMGYRSHYSYRTGTEIKYSAIYGLGDAVKLDGTTSLAQGQYYVNLGEQLYDGKLVLSSSYTTDSFGRPSRHWEYDGKEIGTYIKKELMKEEYTTEVTGRMLYDLIGKSIIDDSLYTFEISIDGEKTIDVLNDTAITDNLTEKEYYFFDRDSLNHSNTNVVGGTGYGTLTQVFVDGSTKTVYISVINTYLARANSDYNTRRGEISLKVWNVQQLSTGELVKEKTHTLFDGTKANVNTNLSVAGDDFEIVKGMKAEDIVLVHVAGGVIKEILDPEVIDNATINSFKLGSYVVTDGRTDPYHYATTALYDVNVLYDYNKTNMKNTTYRIYLDPYGYLVGIEEVDKETYYAFLTGINSYDENLRDQTAIGNLVFLDGTSANVTIDMKESKNAEKLTFNSGAAKKYKYDATDNYMLWYDTRVSSLMNTWVTYSVDENGVYTLTEVANTPATWDSNSPGQHHQGGTYYANANAQKAGTVTHYVNNGDGKTKTATRGTLANVLTPEAGDRKVHESYIEINKGHVYLDGIPETDWVTVYGNNDSVYLSAETALINAKRTISDNQPDNPAIIITGASSVTVGVQDVDLKAFDAQGVVLNNEDYKDGKVTKAQLSYLDVSNGVYTLFDKNGYVIAAMVVGEEDSSNVSFAWVSSQKLSSESLVNGKWEYTRDVIINGKETTLTEIESTGTTPADIAENGTNHDRMAYWWVVRTKADGTVKTATPITAVLGDSAYDDYIYDINDDTKDDIVILNQSFWMDETAAVSGADNIYMDDAIIPDDTGYTIDSGKGVTKYEVRATGSTLQVEGKTGDVRGFAVAPGASIAVVKDEALYRNNSGIPYDYKYKENIEFFENDAKGTGLKQAVDELTNSQNFSGYISAVLKNGRAECVIIYDKTGEQVDIGANPTPGGTNTDRTDVYVDSLDVNVLMISYDPTEDGGKLPTIDHIKAAIEDYYIKVKKETDVEIEVSTYQKKSDPTKAEGTVTVTVYNGSKTSKVHYNFNVLPDATKLP